MANRTTYVEQLCAEAGKSDPATKAEIDRKVGEIALEMLVQSEGRFAELARTQSISVTTVLTKYLLESDFFAAAQEHEILDSDGEFAGVCHIVAKGEILRRKNYDDEYDHQLAHIEFLQDGTGGRGWYLILALEPTAAYTYEFQYYREPTEDDVSVIKEESLLKAGVRAGLPTLFPNTAPVDAQKYYSKLGGFREDQTRYRGQIMVMPNLRTQNLNKLQHRIGRGE
jgi:hypothetical protein